MIYEMVLLNLNVVVLHTVCSKFFHGSCRTIHVRVCFSSPVLWSSVNLWLAAIRVSKCLQQSLVVNKFLSCVESDLNSKLLTAHN